MTNVAPAFQWAQSPNEILLNVKFSHKLDAPATLNVEATNVTILSNQLILQASDGRKKFNLQLELLHEIDANESRYDMASVGRMTFNLRKKISQTKWSRLLKNKNKKISNMHFWYEMQDKYDTELNMLKNASSFSSVDDEKTSKKSKSEVAEKQVNFKPDEDVDFKEDEAVGSQMKIIDDELKAAMKIINEGVKKKKADIELRAKEEKKKVDAEALTEREKLEAKIAGKKQALQVDKSSKSDL